MDREHQRWTLELDEAINRAQMSEEKVASLKDVSAFDSVCRLTALLMDWHWCFRNSCEPNQS